MANSLRFILKCKGVHAEYSIFSSTHGIQLLLLKTIIKIYLIHTCYRMLTRCRSHTLGIQRHFIEKFFRCHFTIFFLLFFFIVFHILFIKYDSVLELQWENGKRMFMNYVKILMKFLFSYSIVHIYIYIFCCDGSVSQKQMTNAWQYPNDYHLSA